MLVCTCGGSFIVRGPGRYGCSFHANRGASVCANSLTVRREVLEERILEALTQELLPEESLRYLAEAVNRVVVKQARAASRAFEDKRLYSKLGQASQEHENIKTAIRQGIVTETTLTMLREVEGRIAALARQIEAEEALRSQQPSVAVTPGLVKQYVQDLRKTLSKDVQKARQALRLLVERVNILPVSLGTPEAHLEAEVVGNVAGLIRLMRPAVSAYGSGGRI